MCQQFQLYLLLAMTSFGALVMKENYFFHSYLKVVLVVVISAILEHFTFFLIGLIDLDDSAILFFLSIFQKIHIYMSKNVASKSKADYKLMVLVHIGKNYQEIISINITKFFI